MTFRYRPASNPSEAASPNTRWLTTPRSQCASARTRSRPPHLARDWSYMSISGLCTGQASAWGQACCVSDAARTPPTAEVKWPDGSSAEVTDTGVLNIVVHLSRDRAGQVEGLLGNFGRPASSSFASRNGRRYREAEITGNSAHDINVRYHQFGAAGGSRSVPRCSSIPAGRAPTRIRIEASRRSR